MGRSALSIFLVGLAIVGQACSSNDGNPADDGAVSPVCAAGQAVQCACMGSVGVATCTAQGTYGLCNCAVGVGAGGTPVASGGFPGAGGVALTGQGGIIASGGIP